MKEKEKELFKCLCSFKADEFDKDLLKYATPAVLGHLFFNRMQAIAYGTLKKHELLGKVNREFRNSLKSAYEKNLEKNKSFFECINHVGEALAEGDCIYAMLKGAYLCKIYPEAYRTSNDIDLLACPNEVTKIGAALSRFGFAQGNVSNGAFVPATRKEIIKSKMTRGETIPYIKEMKLPEMQFLEVDINFSLDYKPSKADILYEMLENRKIVKTDDMTIQCLREDDFFIHLCSHLYKEATTLPWVDMMRDMTLYKYADIYMLLNNEEKEYVDLLFKRAKKVNMDKVCAFAILQTSELFAFENTYAISKSNEALCSDPEFLHTVVSPEDKKKYVYIEKDISSRFFADNRKILLKEVDQ